jgi:hypothetical protein
MTSGTFYLYFTRPLLAIWFRRALMLILFAACLVLLPGTDNASAQSPLVTIRTRVVGTGPNPYSTQVGGSTYNATGAGPGYHVVALNRATLALVSNNTYGLDFTSLNSMYNDVAGLGNNVLVIISSIGPAATISSQAISFLDDVAAFLGGTGNHYIYGGTMSPSAYSLIGVPASGASANQVSTYADPDTDGNISGALILDTQSNYAFTYSTFVTIQTMAGPQNNTIMIGSTTFQAPPLAAGTQGGFHVLIVKRATIDRIKTDPTVVILHSSYATNSSTASTAASETRRMASDLSTYQNGLATGNLVFIIASLGNNPGFNFESGGASSADFETIIGVIAQLGGAGNLNALGFNGYYSIIGIPNSGDPTLSPEVRSYATPQLSGNITAVMQQNNLGLFTPVSSSAFPKASLDLSLYSTAYAAPSQWPVAAHGSDAACPTGDQQCAAYKWISWQIICAGNPSCTDEDVRGHYTDLNLNSSVCSGSFPRLSYPSQPTTQPAGFTFSQQVFNQVVTQLGIERGLCSDIQSFFTNNLTSQVVLATLLTNDLQSAYSAVQTDVQLPAGMSAPPFNILGVWRDALMVAQIVAGGLQPELVPVIATGNALLYLQMQFNNTPTGASNNQVVATVGNLATQIGNSLSSGLASFGVLENLLLTDWIKLQTIGTKIQNAQQGSPWFWSTDTTANIATQLASAYTVRFYQALMRAKYEIVNFYSVPFSKPSDYSYSYGCNIQFGVCCCSGSVYSPPSGAWVSDGSGDLYMAVSRHDGSYPSNTLTSKLFSTMNLYSWDFFLSSRGWSYFVNANPQGWSDYQARGTCGSSSSVCASPLTNLKPGLPGAVLPRRLATPLDDPGACAPVAHGSKGKLHKSPCKPRGNGKRHTQDLSHPSFTTMHGEDGSRYRVQADGDLAHDFDAASCPAPRASRSAAETELRYCVVPRMPVRSTCIAPLRTRQAPL